MLATKRTPIHRATEIRYQLEAAGLALLAAVLLLTGCGGDDSGPRPASTPDGSTPARVEAAALEPGDTRLLIAHGNAIGSITLSGQENRILALDERQNIIEMALSPDGSQVAFVVELPAYTNDKGELDFGADLYVSNLDGSDARRVLEHDSVGSYYEAPAWLNETTLLFGWRGLAADGSTSRIERLDMTTGTHDVVLQNAAMGTLGPDRQDIVYTTIDPQTRVQRLVIESLSASDEPRVLVDEKAGLALFSAVAFSPDGSQLAFAAVDLTDAIPPPPPPQPAGSGLGYRTTSATTTTHPFAQDVWLVNPNDGTGLHRIADIAENMPSVSWSGNSAHLYVFGPGFLWRLDPATGAAEPLRQTGERGSVIWLEGE
jgi:Tol biopolymer transport system component